jgi:SAM-dependent methyltransferase
MTAAEGAGEGRGGHGHPNGHERRFGGRAEILRSAGRVALLDVERVVRLSLEGVTAASVLDVGTGTGIFAEAFAAASLRAVGIDPNPEMIAAARIHLPGAELLEASAEALPFADGSFDVVFLGHVLHETDDPLTALREARRVARLRVAVLEWPYRAEEVGPPLGHRLRPERIDALAREAGFPAVERLDLSHMDFYRLAP